MRKLHRNLIFRSSANHSKNCEIAKELDETKKELEGFKKQAKEDKKFSDEKDRKLRELQQEVEKLKEGKLQCNSKAIVPYSRILHEDIDVMVNKIRWMNQKLMHQEGVFLRELNHRNDIILDATSQIRRLNKELNVMQISYHFFKNLVQSSGLFPRNIKFHEVDPLNDQNSMQRVTEKIREEKTSKYLLTETNSFSDWLLGERNLWSTGKAYIKLAQSVFEGF